MYKNIHIESCACVESRWQGNPKPEEGSQEEKHFWLGVKQGCKEIASEARAGGSWQRWGPTVVHSVYSRVRQVGRPLYFGVSQSFDMSVPARTTSPPPRAIQWQMQSEWSVSTPAAAARPLSPSSNLALSFSGLFESQTTLLFCWVRQRDGQV